MEADARAAWNGAEVQPGPAEGREWAARLLRSVLYLMFVGGLYLFGAGLKREILAEIRGGPAGPTAE